MRRLLTTVSFPFNTRLRGPTALRKMDEVEKQRKLLK